MPPSIVSPADYEVRAVIRFFSAKGVKPIDIHREICEVYGQNVMSDGMVRKWVREHLKMVAQMCMMKNGVGVLRSLMKIWGRKWTKSVLYRIVTENLNYSPYFTIGGTHDCRRHIKHSVNNVFNEESDGNYVEK